MNWWSFYSNTDGSFHRLQFSSSDPDAVAMNTPHGYTAIVGQYNPQTEKVDITQTPPVVVSK